MEIVKLIVLLDEPRDDKKVIDYLNSENSYRDEYMKEYKGLAEDELFRDKV